VIATVYTPDGVPALVGSTGVTVSDRVELPQAAHKLRAPRHNARRRCFFDAKIIKERKTRLRIGVQSFLSLVSRTACVVDAFVVEIESVAPDIEQVIPAPVGQDEIDIFGDDEKPVAVIV
jgi:hypothetical protein